jgi:hypothetical protein
LKRQKIKGKRQKDEVEDKGQKEKDKSTRTKVQECKIRPVSVRGPDSVRGNQARVR